LLHLSRDGGKNWTKITPTGLPEWRTINTIELSKANAGRAIVTAYGYMMNDFMPYVYLTNDYGRTWKRIADGRNGIPDGDYTRVVREDPDRPGLLYAGTEHGMYISFDEGAHWQRFQQNLPATPIMDLKVYRKNLIVATEGRSFWIVDALPVVQQLKAGLENTTAMLFKPADAHRQGGSLPTFYYWFKDAPTAPVALEVKDSTGKIIYTATAEPGSGAAIQAPPPIPPAPAEGAAAGRGGRGGGRGAGGGRGGFGGGGAVLSAQQGLNQVTWNPRLESPFTMPPRIIMWGGGGGRGGGPKAAPGAYTVKLSSGSWSQEQGFRLSTDPRLPQMTEAEGAEQLKMAMEVGGKIKELYDTLAKLRSAKQQATEMSAKTGTNPEILAAAKKLNEQLVDVEDEITQLQGEGGQDALNFPGMIDNQWVTLYGNIVQLERRLNKSVTERYTDLRPKTDDLMERAQGVLKRDVDAFNAVAIKSGAAPIVIK
jgi:hypothetical protein